MPEMDEKPVLIIGAGPAGLALARELGELKIGFRVRDAWGTPGGAYLRMYPKMLLSSPAKHNGLPGLALESADEYVSVARYAQYLKTYGEHFGVEVQKGRVAAVCRSEKKFTVACEGEKSIAARVVVVATGKFDYPVWPEIKGLTPDLPWALHSRDWKGPEAVRNQKLLIVGCGISGVEIAEECARHGLSVTVSARSGKVKIYSRRFLGRDVHDFAIPFGRWPAKWAGWYCKKLPAYPAFDAGFKAFRRSGQITVRGGVASFAGKTAHFKDGTSEDFDVVVLATGYRPRTPFLPPDVTAGQGWYLPLKDGESSKWPGLFFIGRPCTRDVDSEFLWGIRRDAAVVAKRVAEFLKTEFA